MRWPLVSRHALEVAEKYADFCQAGQREAFELLAVERSRNDALQERLLSLKMTGAVEMPVQPIGRDAAGQVTLNSLHGPKPDELRDLIDVKSGGNLRVRGMMLKQLAADRAAGVNDEQIEARILAGVQSDGVPS